MSCGKWPRHQVPAFREMFTLKFCYEPSLLPTHGGLKAKRAWPTTTTMRHTHTHTLTDEQNTKLEQHTAKTNQQEHHIDGTARLLQRQRHLCIKSSRARLRQDSQESQGVQKPSNPESIMVPCRCVEIHTDVNASWTLRQL